MIVLGLGFTDHEASAALVIDGVLKSAISRERLTRLKKDGKMWGNARLDLTACIEYCLDGFELDLDDVDLVVWNHIDHADRDAVLTALAAEGALDLSGRPIMALPHHFAHACCALYLSQFDDAAVFVADGSGGPLNKLLANCVGPEIDDIRASRVTVQNLRKDESLDAREHESFYHHERGKWRCLRKIVGDWGGIGAEYGSASEFLFGDPLHSGKTMGLAPFGIPHPGPIFLAPEGPPEMPAYRSYHPPERDALEEEIRPWLRSKTPADGLYLPRANFAATIQSEVEQALLAHIRWLRQVSGSANLCLSGGVALNSVANALIFKTAGFDRVFVPPAPGDDGISVGCALYGAAYLGEKPRCNIGPYLGRSYTHDPAGIEGLGLRIVATDDLFQRVARVIAEGAVVGWYRGGSEMGPRALGNRSFLADPRRGEMKDHLNAQIKKREAFRPFAPVVLEERALDFFEDHFPSDYMSFVAKIRAGNLAAMPAVAHVDATARYQVLRRTDNAPLYALIQEFEKLTGLPIVLNTSFNVNNEPIVETPVEAARCVLNSGADYLVLDDSLYSKP